MCRIVGIISSKTSPRISEASLVKMRDVLAHGGPDDAGIYADEKLNVILGHRRLSIIDVSSLGHQPMSSRDRQILITYNGEIYNFNEIKKELIAAGHAFDSNSDTEVIVEGYLAWGEKIFEKLNGMFAFCLFDKRTKLIYLVRDYSGIKPLYYSFRDNLLIFGSEIRAFNAFDKEWPSQENWRIYFLLFSFIPEPFTTLKDVYALPKGSYLKYDLISGNHKINKYFQFIRTRKIHDQKQAVDQVRVTLEQAVARHLIADAPLGVFLSGGLDSSILASIASKIKGKDLHTLSIVFEDDKFSEDRYQQAVVDKIKSTHSSYLVKGKDFFNNLTDIFSAMDQPTIDGVNSYFVSKAAKEKGLKAVLSGIGGDELFGGYPSFSRMKYLRILKALLKRPPQVLELFGKSSNYRFQRLQFLAIDDPLSYYLTLRGLFPLEEAASLLGLSRKEIISALGKLHFDTDMSDFDDGDMAGYLESEIYMQNQLLKDADYMSMWHSVEVRVPFLDKELLSLMYSISSSVKYPPGVTKYLLRQAFLRDIPEVVLNRAKQGFTFPITNWISSDFDKIKSLIANDKNKTIDNMLCRFENGVVDWARLWALVVLKKFGNTN